MKFNALMLALTALILPNLAGNASAGTINFGPSGTDPNSGKFANIGAYGSDAVVSVGYSEYALLHKSGYGGLNSGSGAGVYSDTKSSTLVMTFVTAIGNTVTLSSFDLAQGDGYEDSVSISVTGGGSSYNLNHVTPPGGTHFATYSPNETGTSLTLTITNLYNVGINEITYSETTAVPAPEPASLALLSIGFAGLVGIRSSRNKKTAA